VLEAQVRESAITMILAACIVLASSIIITIQYAVTKLENPYLQKARQYVATILIWSYSEDLSRYTGKPGLTDKATSFCNINQAQKSILHHRLGSLDTKPQEVSMGL
jgi:hypothetical protein